MSEKKQHVVVVCGYGCNIDSPLAVYVDRVRNFLRVNRVGQVIFCGGETQKKSFPGKSEAQVMYNYLMVQPEGLQGWHQSHWIQIDSYTTYDNIRLAAEKIRIMKSHDDPNAKFKITIFCEAQRALKVIRLSRHFMRDLVENVDSITIETVSWERADPVRELKTTIMTWLAIKYPWLGLAERERRRRIRRSYEI